MMIRDIKIPSFERQFYKKKKKIIVFYNTKIINIYNKVFVNSIC